MRSIRKSTTLKHAFGMCLLCIVPMTTAADPAAEIMRGRIEQLRAENTLTIGNAKIAAVRLIPELYERRNFAPAWTRPANIEALLDLLAKAEEQGLDPRDYHQAELNTLRPAAAQKPDNTAAQVDLDLLLTDALVRYAYQLKFGKVNPHDLEPNWNFNRTLAGIDAVGAIQSIIEAADLPAQLNKQLPRPPLYRQFQDALARYRAIAAAGGWQAVPPGPTLKPGVQDARVAVVRERLRITGELPASGISDAQTLDTEVVAALEKFQVRHGLTVDGQVGPQTLEALNVPVAERVAQLRVNLERTRWVIDDVEADFIVVNIAGFRAWLMRDGRLAWTTRVQVGKPYRATPIFKSQIKYLVLNPTWTVPPGILRNDILPKLRQDPGYLQVKKLDVIDAGGQRVDPGTIDWNSISAQQFPYQLRQPPGPNNALGRVKFIFPNEHSVYLHDTPSQDLFEHSQRAFSSGCIRVEHAMELAEILLQGTEWDKGAIQKALEMGESRTVFLPKPLTVMLLYWTAEPEADGNVRFLNDVYKRDAALRSALDAAPRFLAPSR